MYTSTRAFALFIGIGMLISSMAPIINSMGNIASTMAVSYPNSDIVAMWIKPDGSDPHYSYSLPWETPDYINGTYPANVTPLVGMTTFGTNTLLISWDYPLNFVVNNTAFFPADCTMYLQSSLDVGNLNNIANAAVWDTRIKGVNIDDFPVGTESPANMSAYYTAIHHEDANLTENLTFMLTMYVRDYFKQSPYSWKDIKDYFDGIHFWLYPWSYPLLYSNLVGYRDDFLQLHSWISEKIFWLGIYLHYYNIGEYPFSFTYELMSIVGKLIKEGYAEKYIILGNYWIQVHPKTVKIIQNCINEHQKNYETTWYFPTDTAVSYSNDIAIYQAKITNISAYHHPQPGPPPRYPPVPTELTNYLPTRTSSYTFDSLALQNLIVTGVDVRETFMVFNQRTGEHEYGYYDPIANTKSYILEPFEPYRIMMFEMTQYWINGNYEIASPTSWNSREIFIDGTLYINSTLTAKYCIFHFGNLEFDRTMYNHTYPKFGLVIKPANSASLRLYDCIIEPLLRSYPYNFSRPMDGSLGNAQLFYMSRSIIACASDVIRATGEIEIMDTTFFQIQPIGSTFTFGIKLELTSSFAVSLIFCNNLVFNYDAIGVVGVFLMPYTRPIETNKFAFQDNTIIGGNWGILIDLTYSENPILTNLKSSTNCTNSCFINFRLNGDPTRQIDITTTTIFKWSVQGSFPSVPSLRIYWTELENGVWIVTHNNDSFRVGITTNTYVLTKYAPWNATLDTFSLTLFSMTTSSEETISGLIWLLMFFLLPIIMVQFVPKIGFVGGMGIMLATFGFADITFMPYMIIGFLAIGILLYKGLGAD